MSNEVLTETEVDRLLKGMGSETPNPTPCDSGRLSIDELDALFGGKPMHRPPVIPLPDNSKPIPEKRYTQDELSALLADMSGSSTESKSDDKQTAERNSNPMEVLSEDEVKSLLNMMDGTIPNPREVERSAEENNPRLPERIDKSLMKQLQLMHDQFAHRIAAKISEVLQSIVEIKLTCVEELCYSEFIFGLDNPTCYNLLRVKTTNGEENMFLDISTSTLFLMIEHMLGGGREPTMPYRRRLSNIELRLSQRIIDEILEELNETWKKIAVLDFTVAQTESDPRMIQVIEPNDSVVVLCFEVNIVEIRGIITLCVPVDVLKQLTASPISPAVMEAFEVFAKANETYDYGE